MKRREIVDITRQDFGATPLSTAHYVFRIYITIKYLTKKRVLVDG